MLQYSVRVQRGRLLLVIVRSALMLLAIVRVRVGVARSHLGGFSISERHRFVILRLGRARNEAAADVLIIRVEG